ADGEEGQPAQPGIGAPTATYCGGDTCGQADDDGEDRGEDGQLHARGQSRGDLGADVDRSGQRGAEVTGEDSTHPLAVLGVPRSVEAQPLPDRGKLGRIRVADV